MRGRRLILATMLISGAAGLAFGYRASDVASVRQNEELAFAYQLHLATVRELIEHAERHAITPSIDLSGALAAANLVADPRDVARFAVFQLRQGRAAHLARELITTMDGELDPTDDVFAHLVVRFNAEEQSLDRIRARRRPGLPRLARSR